MRYLNFLFEVIGCIVFIFTLRKNNNSTFRLLGFFIWYVFLNEILGYYFSTILHKTTTNIYIVYDVISVCFYSYVFYQLRSDKNIVLKGVMMFVTLAISALIVLNYFLGNDVENYYKIKVLAGVYLVALACYYLYSEFVNDDMAEFLIKKPGFWISAGVLMFYSGYSIVVTLHHFTYSRKIFLAGLSVHNFFGRILSVFLYTCLSIAMILWKPAPALKVKNN